MTLVEMLDGRLKKLDYLLEEDFLTDVEYIQLSMPLHEAALMLAKGQKPEVKEEKPHVFLRD